MIDCQSQGKLRALFIFDGIVPIERVDKRIHDANGRDRTTNRPSPQEMALTFPMGCAIVVVAARGGRNANGFNEEIVHFKLDGWTVCTQRRRRGTHMNPSQRRSAQHIRGVVWIIWMQFHPKGGVHQSSAKRKRFHQRSPTTRHDLVISELDHAGDDRTRLRSSFRQRK